LNAKPPSFLASIHYSPFSLPLLLSHYFQTVDAGITVATEDPPPAIVVESCSDDELRKKRNGLLLHKFHKSFSLVNNELERERRFRDDQLSKILKALIYFEAKLRNEQKQIRQQLSEKDDLINRQNCTINSMKRKLGGEDCDLPEVNDVAQYCPKCRKNYYRYEYRSSGTQTVSHVDDNDENLENGNTGERDYRGWLIYSFFLSFFLSLVFTLTSFLKVYEFLMPDLMFKRRKVKRLYDTQLLCKFYIYLIIHNTNNNNNNK
jgi:hypothetical protein